MIVSTMSSARWSSAPSATQAGLWPKLTASSSPAVRFGLWSMCDPSGEFKARLFDAINPVWGWFGAGCQLNRRTLETINDAGFEIAELRREKMGGFPVIVGVAKSTGVPSV